MHPLWMQRMLWLSAVFRTSGLFSVGSPGLHLCTLKPSTATMSLFQSPASETNHWYLHHHPQLPLQGSVFGSSLLFNTGEQRRIQGGHIVLLTFAFVVFFPLYFMPSTPKAQSRKLRLAVSVSGLSFQLVIPTVKVILNSNVSHFIKEGWEGNDFCLKCYCFKP